MELGEDLRGGGEFSRARAIVSDAAWEFVENTDAPAWQRKDIAFDLVELAHDERAADFLTGIHAGDYETMRLVSPILEWANVEEAQELIGQEGLDNHDRARLAKALAEFQTPERISQAIAIAFSIEDTNVFGAALKGKAFIGIAEQIDGKPQQRCIDLAVQAARVLPEGDDASRAFTDPERARIFLRAGTLSRNPEHYEEAFRAYDPIDDSRYDRNEHSATLADEISRELRLLDEDGEGSSELRQALVDLTLDEFGKLEKPWDSPILPLVPVLTPLEQKQLLQNYTKRGKFMLDVAAYRVYLNTAKSEGWLSSWKQFRDEAELKRLEARKHKMRHLDESNTNWDLVRLGYNDDQTIQKALRNIESKRAADLSPEDRADIRMRVVEGLSTGLFSPLQQTVVLGYLHEVRDASPVTIRERFDANLAVMIVEGNTEALAEATGYVLDVKPWEQTVQTSVEHPEFGSFVDQRLAAFLRAVNAGEEKELLATGVLIDK